MKEIDEKKPIRHRNPKIRDTGVKIGGAIGGAIGLIAPFFLGIGFGDFGPMLLSLMLILPSVMLGGLLGFGLASILAKRE